MNAVAGSPVRAVDERALEHLFESIWATRMAGLPFLNPALRVEALGFCDWEGLRLGVLVTPWCINLVLLPGPERTLPPVRSGDEQPYAFPSGVYGFLAHDEPAFGPYHQCSLFSPAGEFATHADAVAAAQAALAALLEPAPAARPTVPTTLTRRGLFVGG